MTIGLRQCRRFVARATSWLLLRYHGRARESISGHASMVKHTGGCHCGRVRFEVEAPAEIVVSACNCSVCAMSGHRGMIVPRERFRLLRGEHALTDYRFNTQRARHRFCSVCGVKSFYIPRSHPEGVSVNASCLDPGTVTDVTVQPIDGHNWERSFPAEGLASYPN